MKKYINDFLKNLKYFCWYVLIVTLLFETVGIKRYYEQTHDTFDLWFWGTIMFVGSTISGYYSIKLYEKTLKDKIKEEQ